MQGNRLKGKREVIVTAYTLSLPFNVIFSESRMAIRAVKKVLHYGGYKLVGTISQTPDQKTKGDRFILVRKSGAVGGETRLGIPLPLNKWISKFI